MDSELLRAIGRRSGDAATALIETEPVDVEMIAERQTRAERSEERDGDGSVFLLEFCRTRSIGVIDKAGCELRRIRNSEMRTRNSFLLV